MADNGKIDVDGLPARPAGNLDSIVGVDKATRQAAQFPVTALPMPQGVVSAIQQQNTTIEAIRASQGSGLPSYATRAALPAPGTLPRPAGGGDPLVTVTNDPTAANNGAWRDTGSAWVQSADRVTGLEGRTSSLEGTDSLIRSLWGLPWLDRDMLTRFGGGTNDWDRPSQPYRVMAAQAIKDIHLEGADPDEQYQIVTMAVGDPVNQDKIIIRTLDNSTTFADSGNVTFPKNPDGPTKVEFGAAGRRVVAWIDYREITETGVLVNSADSPLRIAKPTGHSVLADRVSQNESDLVTATQTANAASAAAGPEYGVYILGTIWDGAYPAALRAKVGGELTEFHADLLSGSGSAVVDVMVGSLVVGTFDVGGPTTQAISAAINEGDRVIFLVSGAAGVTGLWAQVTGDEA